MRFFLIITVLTAGLMAGSAARAQVDARSIVEGCHDVVLVSRGQLPQGRGETAGECLGAVAAVGEALTRLHERYYKGRFPSYPVKGEAAVNALVASIIMFGPDVCFPTGRVEMRELAFAVDRYAQAHPQEITGGVFEFVVKAIDTEYTCGPNHPRH